jgi:hypothetical protein
MLTDNRGWEAGRIQDGRARHSSMCVGTGYAGSSPSRRNHPDGVYKPVPVQFVFCHWWPNMNSTPRPNQTGLWSYLIGLERLMYRLVDTKIYRNTSRGYPFTMDGQYTCQSKETWSPILETDQ